LLAAIYPAVLQILQQKKDTRTRALEQPEKFLARLCFRFKVRFTVESKPFGIDLDMVESDGDIYVVKV